MSGVGKTRGERQIHSVDECFRVSLWTKAEMWEEHKGVKEELSVVLSGE